MSKPAGTWYYLTAGDLVAEDSKREGIFSLVDEGDGFALFGDSSMRDDAEAYPAFARVLAGGSERPPAATPEQVKKWTAQADVIVFAAARAHDDDIVRHAPRADFSASATLTPIEVLKGDLEEQVDVVQAPQPDVPGGTWAFPVASTLRGVYFLDTSADVPRVLNTTDPSGINRRRLPL